MIKIEDIVKKKFSRAFIGYDMREVDLFLDGVIEQIEVYEREREEMLTAMEYLLRELEQFDDIADVAEKRLRSMREQPDDQCADVQEDVLSADDIETGNSAPQIVEDTVAATPLNPSVSDADGRAVNGVPDPDLRS